jgi:hypothetical protein
MKREPAEAVKQKAIKEESRRRLPASALFFYPTPSA